MNIRPVGPGNRPGGPIFIALRNVLARRRLPVILNQNGRTVSAPAPCLLVPDCSYLTKS
jgi:hypothetical protein